MRLQILFDDTQTIVGARIRTYLLERSRLVYQPETERNYHIFYQLLAGAPSSERKSLGLDSAASFTFLNQGGSNAITIPGVDDAAEFATTQRALSTVGITVERQWQIFRLLAALLHLGNMQIKATRTDALLDDEDPSLTLATQLLGIDKSEFKKWILKKQIVTRTDKIVTSLNAAQANIVKDSVAKHIYASLFDWLVSVTNESLTNEKVEGSVKSFIGVLVCLLSPLVSKTGDSPQSCCYRISTVSSTSRRTASNSFVSTMPTRNFNKRYAFSLFSSRNNQ